MASRILALDYGTKRIGVALSDELGWTAQPLETFDRRTLDRDIAHIAAVVRSNEVAQVVLGLPLQLDGREGPAVEAMREFAAKLEAGLPVPLILWDERMTTKAAEDLLIAADVSRKKRKGVVDRIAAAILLQSYLAAQAPDASRDSGNRADDEVDTHAEFSAIDEPPHETTSRAYHPGRRRRGRRSGLVSDDSMG
ncbi:MAG: Holliday junction resolvase RuvX [Nitrospira sp.]|nr:Holliday junction resolvase RuvX [Nitrospira sp.]